MNEKHRTKALLSVQRALLGEIKTYMRAISLEATDSTLKLWVFHDGAVSSDEIQYFDSVTMTQIAADFSHIETGDPKCEFEFVRVDQPGKFELRGEFVFFRWEAERNEGL